MKFGNLFEGLFPRKKTIRSVTPDDLRKERIGLENEERRLIKDLELRQKDDAQLLSEYAAASQAGNDRQKKILARRVQELRSQMTSLDQRHGFLSKQMRVVNGLITIKENEAFLARLGANSKLAQMDLAELQHYVEQATVDGELTNEKLETLVATMNEAGETFARSESDTGLDAFMEDLDKTVQTREPAQPLEPAITPNIDQAITALDQEIARAAPAKGADTETKA